MSIKKRLMNKEEVYGKAFVLANIFLILSVIIFFIYLVAPLLGGKFSARALIHYGSWIGLALGMRILSQRARNGLWIRAYEYTLACLAAVVNFVIWFPYPINIILSILSVVSVVISYRAQKNK